MSLPKRNSADGRCYWMKPEVQEELQPLFDQCIQDAIDGRITRLDSLWPPVVVSSQGAPFEVCDLVRKWIETQRAETMDAEKAIAFSENLRRQSRWGEIDYYLINLLKRELQEKYFVGTGSEDDYWKEQEYSLKPGIRAEDLSEELLRFACYVAVCHTVYGQSFESLKTEHILGLVSQLRPDMVKQLKTNGSGKLPKGIQRRKTEHFTASANDAFATIRITARDSTEECYAEILDYLCAVLSQEEFPRSYSVEFRGKDKLYLPIPGLPKKGVNQLFACAVQHPKLHTDIERYARLAMREYEWYQNLADEACAMPGSFAVFALGLEGEQWATLVAEYLDLCDDEHSSLQGKFLHALIRKFGFQPWTLGVLVRGALSMQWLEPAREFRSLIANAESLDALLAVKRRFSAYLLPEENEDPKFRAIAWQSLLWAIWGPASENGGSKAIKTAPKELKEKYQQVFA